MNEPQPVYLRELTPQFYSGPPDASDYTLVREFHQTFGCAVAQVATVELIRARWALIAEEIAELAGTLFELELVDQPRLASEIRELFGRAPRVRNQIDPQDVAKEAADVLYVVHGLGVNTGIDTSTALAAVHESNMSKAWPDGQARYRSDGKVLKPPDYAPPNMRSALADFPTGEVNE